MRTLNIRIFIVFAHVLLHIDVNIIDLVYAMHAVIVSHRFITQCRNRTSCNKSLNLKFNEVIVC